MDGMHGACKELDERREVDLWPPVDTVIDEQFMVTGLLGKSSNPLSNPINLSIKLVGIKHKSF